MPYFKPLNNSDFYKLGFEVLKEQSDHLKKIDVKYLIPTINLIKKSKKIFLYGVGREGLMLRGLGMRLFHLGLEAHIIGDMTVPPIKKGDLFITSAGPGHFSTVEALMKIAKQNQAQVLCFTSRPKGKCPKKSDQVFVVPAQTMASANQGSTILPMGSLYEIMLFLVFELLVIFLKNELKKDATEMITKHTNLE